MDHICKNCDYYCRSSRGWGGTCDAPIPYWVPTPHDSVYMNEDSGNDCDAFKPKEEDEDEEQDA